MPTPDDLPAEDSGALARPPHSRTAAHEAALDRLAAQARARAERAHAANRERRRRKARESYRRQKGLPLEAATPSSAPRPVDLLKVDDHGNDPLEGLFSILEEGAW
jgi:hypothetical protein